MADWMCRGRGGAARRGTFVDGAHQIAHGGPDRLQMRMFIGQGDPGRQHPRATFVEGVEDDVDQRARRTNIRSHMGDRRTDRLRKVAHHGAHQCRLDSAAEPKWWIRLPCVMPISSATVTSVMPLGPCRRSSFRAEASASSRASPGERRRRARRRLAVRLTTDTDVNSSVCAATMLPGCGKCKYLPDGINGGFGYEMYQRKNFGRRKAVTLRVAARSRSSMSLSGSPITASPNAMSAMNNTVEVTPRCGSPFS